MMTLRMIIEILRDLQLCLMERKKIKRTTIKNTVSMEFHNYFARKVEEI